MFLCLWKVLLVHNMLEVKCLNFRNENRKKWKIYNLASISMRTLEKE